MPRMSEYRRHAAAAEDELLRAQRYPVGMTADQHLQVALVRAVLTLAEAVRQHGADGYGYIDTGAEDL